MFWGTLSAKCPQSVVHPGCAVLGVCSQVVSGRLAEHFLTRSLTETGERDQLARQQSLIPFRFPDLCSEIRLRRTNGILKPQLLQHVARCMRIAFACLLSGDNLRALQSPFLKLYCLRQENGS